MGLDINNYGYSYSMLHELRQFALDVEFGVGKVKIDEFYESGSKSEKFNEFINHSDCEGGYIALETLGLKIVDEAKFRVDLTYGDLDKLKEELIELKKHISLIKDENVLQAFNDFFEDVMEESYILEFH